MVTDIVMATEILIKNKNNIYSFFHLTLFVFDEDAVPDSYGLGKVRTVFSKTTTSSFFCPDPQGYCLAYRYPGRFYAL